MAVLFSALGAILLIYGGVLCVLFNMNMGGVAVVLLGVLALLWGIFYQKVKAATRKGPLKYLKILVCVLLAAELVLVGFLAIYGARDTVSHQEDAIIVLGAGIKGDEVSRTLQLRLDKAIEYAQENPEALIVVSGGRGPQESVTEAYAMEKYLLENGIRPEKIIKEEQATSTQENLRYSKELLDKRFTAPYQVVVITNGFHIYRAASMAQAEGFADATHLHAGLQWYQILPCYLRESLAVLKMWLLG